MLKLMNSSLMKLKINSPFRRENGKCSNLMKECLTRLKTCRITCNFKINMQISTRTTIKLPESLTMLEYTNFFQFTHQQLKEKNKKKIK